MIRLHCGFALVSLASGTWHSCHHVSTQRKVSHHDKYTACLRCADTAAVAVPLGSGQRGQCAQHPPYVAHVSIFTLCNNRNADDQDVHCTSAHHAVSCPLLLVNMHRRV